MGVDVDFCKIVKEIIQDKEWDTTNLRIIQRNYEGVEPLLISEEYYDIEKLFEGKNFCNVMYYPDFIKAEVDGVEVEIPHDLVPTFNQMEKCVPIEQIGYYRISYEGSFCHTEDTLSIGFSKQDQLIMDIFDKVLEDGQDCNPEFFRNNVIKSLKENGFEDIGNELEEKLNELPETQIIYISY